MVTRWVFSLRLILIIKYIIDPDFGVIIYNSLLRKKRLLMEEETS